MNRDILHESLEPSMSLCCSHRLFELISLLSSQVLHLSAIEIYRTRLTVRLFGPSLRLVSLIDRSRRFMNGPHHERTSDQESNESHKRCRL